MVYNRYFKIHIKFLNKLDKIKEPFSGGVDSSVLAALCYKAIGEDRVKCIHIDNGFMRKG